MDHALRRTVKRAILVLALLVALGVGLAMALLARMPVEVDPVDGGMRLRSRADQPWTALLRVGPWQATAELAPRQTLTIPIPAEHDTPSLPRVVELIRPGSTVPAWTIAFEEPSISAGATGLSASAGGRRVTTNLREILGLGR